MAEEFSRPHINVSDRKVSHSYKAPKQNRGGGGAPRIREEHGARIQQELRATFAIADDTEINVAGWEKPQGQYIEVELGPRKNPAGLEKKRESIKPGAAKIEPNETVTVALYVPDTARDVLQRIISDYTDGPLTKGGNPSHKDFVEPIEAIRQARLQTFWTDDAEMLPTNPDESIWWEVWCFDGTQEDISTRAQMLGGQIADRHYWLSFPEITVVPIFTTRVSIELLLFASFGIAELRRASATPHFFTSDDHEHQFEWAQELAERVTWPGSDAVSICLLDTGVNRAHALLEPALQPKDTLSVNLAWGTDDHEGHGTHMSGLLLHGDLTPRLVDQSRYALTHRLESVKVIPPSGFPANEPASYGPITQSGVSIAEINSPARSRVFCMAITNENVSGSRSTAWSAALDQIATGAMDGDEDQGPRRLFVVSAGNVPAHTERSRILPVDDYPIEDPAQSWNALTVGGYTDKNEISEDDLEGWTPLSDPGDVSPFTRSSVTWPQGKSAIKPEIVMEAGNRAVSPGGDEVLNVDSLSVLTTGDDVDRQPLAPFLATSAATAQAARLCARLSAAFPEYWPETIRALIVHSAEWTSVMLDQLEQANGMRDRYPLLRRFGYGVPSFERAVASANNHLALVAQNGIQPFRAEKGERRFGECHYYRLPWPQRVLEDLGETEVRLKIALSYFVEPNPGVSSSIDPQRYQSFGLRFDLRRRLEDVDDFKRRVNADEIEDAHPRRGASADEGWVFGSNSMSAGSLHCDEWRGPAAQLASRDMLCIKPVAGWWRNRAAVDICNKETRYALVVTLSTDDTEIDLYTSVESLIASEVEIEITS